MYLHGPFTFFQDLKPGSHTLNVQAEERSFKIKNIVRDITDVTAHPSRMV